MNDVPRNTGLDVDGIARTEIDHFMKCPDCGQWFDMRALGQVFEHAHDGDIKIIVSEGPPTLQ